MTIYTRPFRDSHKKQKLPPIIDLALLSKLSILIGSGLEIGHFIQRQGEK